MGADTCWNFETIPSNAAGGEACQTSVRKENKAKKPERLPGVCLCWPHSIKELCIRWLRQEKFYMSFKQTLISKAAWHLTFYPVLLPVCMGRWDGTQSFSVKMNSFTYIHSGNNYWFDCLAFFANVKHTFGKTLTTITWISAIYQTLPHRQVGFLNSRSLSLCCCDI